MRFEQNAVVQAAPDAVWDMLMDMSFVAACVPGLSDFEDLGDGRYAGTLRVSVGPIALAMKGIVTYIQRDPETGTATLRAEAADARAAGSIKAETEIQLSEDPSTATRTRLAIRTDATIMGRIGEFGQPIIRRKAEQLVTDFARNLSSSAGTER